MEPAALTISTRLYLFVSLPQCYFASFRDNLNPPDKYSYINIAPTHIQCYSQKMPRQCQLSFKSAPSFKKHFRTEHGGSLYKGKRKEARPLTVKSPIHIVFRSSRARGKWSFLHPQNRASVQKLVRKIASRFDVKIQQIANSGNHLHIIAQGKHRTGLQSFLRTCPAMLARKITGAKKGSPAGRFWDALAYTRIVNWGRELVALKRYLLRNDLEAVGFLSHRNERALGFAEALARRGLRLVL